METKPRDPAIQELLDKQDIRDVLFRYCRGIDRFDADLVRSCYHDDARDDHGRYKGGVDGFIDFVFPELARFERTMHFIGNVLIDVQGDTAHSEAYCMAYHRIKDTGQGEREFSAAVRYVDRFERRSGGPWLIADRVVVFDWGSVDPVSRAVPVGPDAVAGMRDRTDRVYGR